MMWLKASACFLALAVVAWVIFDAGKDSGILEESQKNTAVFQSPLNERDQDSADKGDIEGITRRINGGLNGLADRKALYERALKVLA